MPPPSSLVRMLFVGDPQEHRQIAGRLKDSKGTEYEVGHASDLDRALSRLRDEPFHVVLFDLDAVECGGLDALARAQVAASEIPIIALSEQDDEEEAVHALRLGAQDYLAREQATPRMLARSIRHALERHRLFEELQRARQREHYMATHDPLTGLANRYSFNEHLDRALAYAGRHNKRLGVFFLDLDGFKYINDTLGHSVGDKLLDEVAERLASEVRRSDIIARVGGDEFIAMVQDLERDQVAALVAQKMLESISMPYQLEGREYWVTASLGIASFPRDGHDRETLVRHADAAMYQAKALGRNTYQFYASSLNDASRRRLTLERSLRRAFERGELVIHYQPIVEIATNRITGAEALVRWTDPELGPVSPAEFIPLAEETGLIRPLGDWVLRTACSQAKSWRDAGFEGLRVAVNVSTHQIAREVLRESIVRALWDTGLDASALQLELTEGSLMKNTSLLTATLQEIVQIGVGISLDDFGTGFSSLSYLKVIPVDSVKIDRSFVSDIVADPDDAAIVAAILSIAEQLQLRVIAEGVETLEQRNFLLARGCLEMQGHLFSRALPPDEFLALLRKTAPRS